jgi:hypothetical protein
MSLQDAQRAVVGRAASELLQVDVSSPCRMLGLPPPQGNLLRCGDEEFGPAAEILFDACVRRVFTTEEVAHLTSCICLGLL